MPPCPVPCASSAWRARRKHFSRLSYSRRTASASTKTANSCGARSSTAASALRSWRTPRACASPPWRAPPPRDPTGVNLAEIKKTTLALFWPVGVFVLSFSFPRYCYYLNTWLPRELLPHSPRLETSALLRARVSPHHSNVVFAVRRHIVEWRASPGVASRRGCSQSSPVDPLSLIVHQPRPRKRRHPYERRRRWFRSAPKICRTHGEAESVREHCRSRCQRWPAIASYRILSSQLLLPPPLPPSFPPPPPRQSD